jgi:hypothetical protein
MIAATVVLILLLWAIDDATRGLAPGLACLIFLMPALALAESAILTALLTHGFIAAIILCALAPREGPFAGATPVPTSAGRASPTVGAGATGPPLVSTPPG